MSRSGSGVRTLSNASGESIVAWQPQERGGLQQDQNIRVEGWWQIQEWEKNFRRGKD